MKNPWFPRLARNSELIRHRFDFEHESTAGTILVTVYGPDDFECWHLDADRPFDFHGLGKTDRESITAKICDRFQRQESPSSDQSASERRAEIAELNAQRGIR